MHLAGDHRPAAVAARVREGLWTRVRPGAYVAASSLGGPDAAEVVELARIAALALQLREGTVFSHDSAALLWGLPLLRTPTSAHVVQARASRPRCSPDVVRHVGMPPAEQRTARLGLPTTTLERTLLDCAATGGVAAGLVVADAAMRRGARREVCEEILATWSGRRGVAVARAVLAAADDGSESPGETLARLAVLRVGLPAPVTQVPVPTRLGTFWGDLGWPEWRLLLEYDGRGKYDVGREALLAEKRREDALREAGWLILRITMVDLASTWALGDRIRRLSPHARRAPVIRRPELT